MRDDPSIGKARRIVDRFRLAKHNPGSNPSIERTFGVISRHAMKLIGAILLLCSLSYPFASQQCKCGAPEPGATTRKGYFEEIRLEPKTHYRKLAGVVSLSDRPVDNVLVELFPYAKESSIKRARLAACITGSDGRYCFSRVSKGNYELRASKDGGFEITHVYIVVEPGNRRASNTDLGISIEVGK